MTIRKRKITTYSHVTITSVYTYSCIIYTNNFFPLFSNPRHEPESHKYFFHTFRSPRDTSQRHTSERSHVPAPFIPYYKQNTDVFIFSDPRSTRHPSFIHPSPPSAGDKFTSRAHASDEKPARVTSHILNIYTRV